MLDHLMNIWELLSEKQNKQQQKKNILANILLKQKTIKKTLFYY